MVKSLTGGFEPETFMKPLSYCVCDSHLPVLLSPAAQCQEVA